MLFSGMNGATICDECVERGYDVLQEQQEAKKKKSAKNVPTLRREDVPKLGRQQLWHRRSGNCVSPSVHLLGEGKHHLS